MRNININVNILNSCASELNNRLMQKKWFEPYTEFNLPIYNIDKVLEFDRKSAEKIYVSRVNDDCYVKELDRYLIDSVQDILDKWDIKEFNCWNLYKKYHYRKSESNFWVLVDIDL